jgi:signal transduction histidine kinase/HPt (histidine-containing phosphotransfer) domain-containing protein
MTHAGRVYRLLIVDDDGIDRRRYISLLNQQAPGACEITQTGKGEEGLAALRERKFDCILLDFNLPDMTGHGFLAAAMVNNVLPCAVVLVTGQGSEGVAVGAMKLGVQDYLAKDKVTAGSLWRAMTHAVTQTELRQSLAETMRDLTSANAALEQEIATRKAAEVELRAAMDAAELASQAKTRFVAMVTHELRTPLNGILGYAQLLRMDGSMSPQQATRIDAMMQAGHHLLNMIESVLDFAAIEAGRMELRPVTVSVAELAEECIAFIGPMATEHRLSLRMLRSHDAPDHIHADPGRLRQVLLNLLGNAVKYTREGGVELRVVSAKTPGVLRFEVADTGPGIAEANRGHLFQDFERFDTASSLQGAGLGLAIAARIIRQMNGAIGYQPNPGGGSIFWLEVPANNVTSVPRPAKPSATPVSVPRSVLLVEDVAMNRDVIDAFLRAAGHEVTQANDGVEAVKLASATLFDVILMDVRMPEMDGLEATRRIRTLPDKRGKVPILALTAYAFPEQVAECREAGMDGHISKPVNYTALIRAIAAVTADTKPLEGDRPEVLPAAAKAEEPAPVVRHDTARYAEALAFLSPDDVVGYLESLHERCEQILRLLDQSDEPLVLTDTVHTLASTAGMLGFEALSDASRHFERMLAGGTPRSEELATRLRTETRAAMTTLTRLIHERGMQPA